MFLLLSKFVRLLQICLLLLTMISVNGFTIGSSVEKLTQCSKYDFEEKLLEKVVRLEHSIELERKLKEFEDMMSEKLRKIETVHSEKMKEMENNMNVKLTHMDEEDTRRKDSFKSLREEFADQLSRQKDVFVDVIQNFTANSEDLSDKIIDKHNNLMNAFERKAANQKKRFDKKVVEMNGNFTSFLATTKEVSENQQQALTDVMTEVKLNTSLLNTKLLHQQKINEKKVVLVGCTNNAVKYNSGSTYKFPKILTKVGLSRLSDFRFTGKFICPAKGVYHISAVLTTNQDNTYVDIMKNSVSMHHQYLNGYSHSGNYWTPGTAIGALELNVNDTVWIKTGTSAHLYFSCLTIFKL